MPMLVFTGRILPSPIELSFNGLPSINWSAPSAGLTMTFTATIDKSIVRVSCDVNKFDQSDLVPIYMRARDIASTLVDLAVFATGISSQCVIETLTLPTGEITQLVNQDTSLARSLTA